MKKSSRRCSIAILMMICLCIVLSIPSIPVQAADNLSENEMIYGADIGFLSQLESQGVEWVDDNGNTRDALELLKEKGVKNIRLMCIIAAPEGVKKMQEEHPDVDVYIGALDDHLNEHGYIVPGLGDAGDRIFGTK